MRYTISVSLRRLLDMEAPKSRPIAILNRILRRAAHRPTSILNKKPIGDYFTFRERHGMISYMPRGREQKINPDGTWKLEGRQSIAPGRWLRSMFSDRAIKRLKIKDNEFADIATAIKSIEGAPGMKFELVGVKAGYDSLNFICDLPESCMWDEPVEEFYDLFNARVLVCVNEEGLFMARAIVWEDVHIAGHHGKSFTFMDRIYCDAPWVVRAMQEYARAQGWAYKVPQRRGEGEIMLPDGTGCFATMSICCNDVFADFYPCLDTFQYGNENCISTSSSHMPYAYTLTDGHREEEDQHEGQVEDVDGDWIDEDDAVCIDRRGYEGYYHLDSYRICLLASGRWDIRDYCVEINGKWYQEDDDNVVETRTGWFLKSDCAEFDGCFYHTADMMLECGTWVPRGYVAEGKLLTPENCGQSNG